MILRSGEISPQGGPEEQSIVDDGLAEELVDGPRTPEHGSSPDSIDEA